MDVTNGTSLNISSYSIVGPPPSSCYNISGSNEQPRPTVQVMGDGSLVDMKGEYSIVFGSNYTNMGGTAVMLSDGGRGGFFAGSLAGGNIVGDDFEEDTEGGDALVVDGVNSHAEIDGATLVGGRGYYVGNSLLVKDNATATIFSGDFQDAIQINNGAEVEVRGGLFRKRITVIGPGSHIKFFGCFEIIDSGLRLELIGKFDGSEIIVKIEVVTASEGIMEVEGQDCGTALTEPPSGSPTASLPVTVEPTTAAANRGSALGRQPLIYGIRSVIIGLAVGYLFSFPQML